MGRQWAVAIVGFLGIAVLAGSAPNSVTLEVSVRSSVDSKPIRGAEITVERVYQGAATGAPAEDLDDLVITRAESNERGEIVLRELPAVPMKLKLRAEGYVSPAIDDLREQSWKRVELLLPRAIEVTGVVVDETGKAVPNATVELSSVLDMNTRVVPVGESLSARTNASGEFRIKGAPEGTGKFAVTAAGYSLMDGDGAHRLLKEPVRLIIRPTGVLRVDIDAPLHKRGQYTIKVERKHSQKLVQEKRGADRGNVSFVDLPAGQYIVSAWINPLREPQTPLTAIVEIKVGQTTDVRLTSEK